MFERAILPDLGARMAESGEAGGHHEPGHPHLGHERVGAGRGARRPGRRRSTAPAADGSSTRSTLAFLASGIEGIKVRITARAPTEPEVDALLGRGGGRGAGRPRRAARRHRLRCRRRDDGARGGRAARRAGPHLGLAESLTGGLDRVPAWSTCPAPAAGSAGCVVAYDSEVKHSILGVADGPVVSRGGRRGDGPGGPSGARLRRRSRHHRRGRTRRAGGSADPGRSSSGSRAPTATGRSAASCTFPGTATGSGSSARSRPSTCCGGRSGRPLAPSGSRAVGRGRSGFVVRGGRPASTPSAAGDPLDGPQRDVALAALEATDVGPVDAEQVGERLLAQALGQPERGGGCGRAGAAGPLPRAPPWPPATSRSTD